MPLLKKPRKTESLVKVLDKKAQKNGLHRTIYSTNGDQYTGEWRDNMRHGEGTQVWKRAGALYKGEWKQNVREGYGILSKLQPSTNENVKVYSGTWRNDKKEGFGTRFYSLSARYEGEWVENERSGWGRMNYENGDVYEGEWLKDKPHGQGVLWLVNETRYEGSWKDGKKHGYGRFFYTDRGQLYEGFWVDDVPRCGTVCDYDRKHAHTPPRYPIPPVMLQDVQSVLMEGHSRFWGSKED
ncbi:MORN repeat-containing protein 3 [Neoarius graeffei]|uniref:MORN repeat-containing protein 3 n=1 Tax=Neoarius graeffei TaxID=443677 RepID=UPI00298D4573|nr:MORN repeat-containing protein 3 [Neoarius graeffei]